MTFITENIFWLFPLAIGLNTMGWIVCIFISLLIWVYAIAPVLAKKPDKKSDPPPLTAAELAAVAKAKAELAAQQDAKQLTNALEKVPGAITETAENKGVSALTLSEEDQLKADALKAVSQQQAATSAIPAVPRNYKLESNIDYPGNHGIYHVGQFTECAPLCDKMRNDFFDKCWGYTIDKEQGKNCWLLVPNKANGIFIKLDSKMRDSVIYDYH